MTLRMKTLLLIGVTLVILTFALYLALRSILLHGFAMLEEQEITTELDAVTTYLASEARSMFSHLGDWSNWDDTYAFAQEYDVGYIEQNITPSTFGTLQINLMLFLNPRGELIYAAGTEPAGNTMPTYRLASFYRTVMDYREREQVEAFAGFMTLSQEVFMVVGRPIYGNDGTGEPGGTLVWVRILDPQTVAYYGEALAHRFMVTVTHSPTLTDDERLAVEQLAEHQHFADTRSTQVAYGYTSITDLNAQPSILVRVEIGREVYLQGEESSLYYLFTLLFIGVILVLCVMFIIENFVLIPVWRLSGDVRSIAATRDFTRRLPVRGSDELTELARGINTMLQAVESSEDALKHLNADLETRVTERTAEIAEKNKELANVQAQKDAFFARASHELRTPLTNIITRVYLLEKQPEQVETHMRVLRVVSSYMRDLINEILEISRLQRGSVTINRAQVQAQSIVRAVLDIQHAEAERKQLTLRAEMDDAPVYVSADAKRLTQIITNLVSNAINFTPQDGEVVVQVSADDQNAIIRVRDTGLGIAPEHLPHLFEPFFRAREEISVGTGLGLVIVRELVRLHDGSVSVESVVGTGTTFTVTLPLLKTDDKPSVFTPASAVLHNFQPHP